MTKKLGIDFGNCTICFAGEGSEKTIKRNYIDSTYTTSLGSDLDDVVGYNGVTIKLGARGATANELSNVNKVEREYLEHQILWSAYKCYGSGNHHIKLAVGLPIIDYLNKVKQEAFLEKLKGFNTLTGTVEGKNVTLTIIPDQVKIYAEGHATLKVLFTYLSRSFGNLVIDIGLKSTDISIYEWVDGKFKAVATETIPVALDSILSPIQAELELKGAHYKITQIDRLIREEKYIIRTEQGDYDLKAALMLRTTESTNIIKEIENKVGKTLNYNKLFIGGGSKIFLDILGRDRISNLISVPNDIQYYANAIAYFLNM